MKYLRLYLKEWRENLAVVGMALLVLAALTLLALSDRQDLTLYVSGMFLWMFIPFVGLLLGSGAFNSELRDSGWIYLFSRPIRREAVWFVKYLAAFSALLLIQILFTGLMRILPGLSQTAVDISFRSPLTGLALSVLALTLAFSLSILHDKQIVLVFSAITLGIGLMLGVWSYSKFVYSRFYYYGGLSGFYVLIGLALAGASLLTFLRVDFSQPFRKFRTFCGSALAFLLAAVLLTSLWVTRGRLFSTPIRVNWNIWFQTADDLYFKTPAGGLARFDPDTARFSPLDRRINRLGFRPSLAAGKVAGFWFTDPALRIFAGDLWLYNLDGSGGTELLERNDPESPFYGLDFGTRCVLAPDGNRLAFLSFPPGEGYDALSPTLWWMRADGTRMRSFIPDSEGRRDYSVVAWAESGRSLLLACTPRAFWDHRRIYELWKVDLETREMELLVDGVNPPHRFSISKDQKALAFVSYDDERGEQTLAVLSLDTLESSDILTRDSLDKWASRWNRRADRLAFSVSGEVLIYEMDSDRIIPVTKIPGEEAPLFDFTGIDDTLAVLSAGETNDGRLLIFNSDYRLRREWPMPGDLRVPVVLWGVKDRILVMYRGRGYRLIDPATGGITRVR